MPTGAMVALILISVVLSGAAGAFGGWVMARRRGERHSDLVNDVVSPEAGRRVHRGPRRRATDVPAPGADVEEAMAITASEDLSRRALGLGLARLAEARDRNTGRHLERVRLYTQTLAADLSASHPEIDAAAVSLIAEASVLHDIGKVGIPDEVLHHPGDLSDEAKETVRRHTFIGGDALLAMRRRFGEDPFLVTACEIILAHHEWWDGSGYPFGLEREGIPVAARIVAVADVYDAMTSNRAYREAGSHEEARATIVAGSGRQFDPSVVEAFLRCEQAFISIRREVGDSEEPPAS